MEQKIELFSWQAIFRIIVVILGTLIIWKTMSALILLLISIMLATALYPIVKRINKRLPIPVATLLVVLMLLAPIIFLVALVVPSFISEGPQLLEQLDRLLNNSTLLPQSLRNVDFTQYVQNSGSYILRSTNVVTSTVTSIITVIFMTFYLITDADRLTRLFLSVFPKEKRADIRNVLIELAIVNGQYIRGNLLISFICMVVIFLGLIGLSVPFAAPLAIFAGLLDLLPLIGSTIAMIPAVIIGFSVSPLVGVLVIILFLIYQQLENALIAPHVYNRALNLSAALSFIAVIIGATLFGILGAFLALPIAASLPVLAKYVKDEQLLEFDK